MGGIGGNKGIHIKLKSFRSDIYDGRRGRDFSKNISLQTVYQIEHKRCDWDDMDIPICSNRLLSISKMTAIVALKTSLKPYVGLIRNVLGHWGNTMTQICSNGSARISKLAAMAVIL